MSVTPITSLAYNFPSIGVWMCVFQASVLNLPNTATIECVLSTSSTAYETSWSYPSVIWGSGIIQNTRILTVTNLTTTIYPLLEASSNNPVPTIMYCTLQCVRIA